MSETNGEKGVAPSADSGDALVNDEFSIDAGRFRQALIEQRRIHLKGSVYHLNQIQMAFNSNHLEGSQLTEEQTRYLYETRTIDGLAGADDVIEASNHFHLFNVMLDNVGTPITPERMKEYHAILKSGTQDSRLEWFAVGDWKRRENEVGHSRTTPPDRVAEAIQSLLAHTPSHMAFDDICDFHHQFETIHPFQDGNGRVGRILMFEQCLANGIMPFIVLDEEKLYYYRGRAQYERNPGFLRETFRHFQDEYHRSYSRFL